MKLFIPTKFTKIIIVLLVGIIILLITFVLKNKPPTSEPPRPISALPITPIAQKQNPSTINDQITNPAPLPLVGNTYRVQTNVNTKDYATTLGFTETDIQASRTTNERTMWYSKDRGQLTITASPGWHIYYQSVATPKPSPLQIDPSQIDTIVNSIIATHMDPISPYPIEVGTIEYLEGSSSNYQRVSKINDANTVKIYLQTKLDGKILLTNTRPLGVGTITLNFDGTLNNFTFTPPPTIVSQQEISLLPATQTINLLREGKGTLISAKTASPPSLSFEPDFSTITLLKQELIYLYQPETQIIAPIYLLTGRANDQQTKVRYEIIYLVPAY